jgi:uncharacterized protein
MEEKIFIKNKSGLKLATVIHQPEGSGRFPVVILLVGFTGYKEWPPIELLAKSLAENGIGAVRFDPSGFGESEGTLEKDYRFSNYVKDSQSIFDFVTGLNWVRKEKIGVYGQSIGGIMASVLTKNNHISVKALSLVSSPIIMGSDDDLNSKYKNWGKDGYIERSNSRYGRFNIPFAFIEDAKKWNALAYLKGLNVPVQVIWCSDDTNVPNKITKQLYDSAAGPKEFKVLEGADHFLNRDPKTIKVMIDTVVRFMLRRLK